MLISARKTPDGTEFETDLCIVGAGPAGITLALALRGRGLRVLLIEAGGPKGEAGAQKLYHGESSDPAFHQLPDTDRTRGLGGTSSMWGGRCMPYDPVDFEPRAHMPNSGWPFAREELDPYYRTAQKMAEAGDWAYTTADAGLPGDMIEGAQTEALRLDTLERWSPPTHFGKRYRTELETSSEITVLTGAALVQIAQNGKHVQQLHLKSVKGGKSFTVKAARYVLSGGGLEVPRQLLHAGIGDHSGWLGRGYMSHVSGVIARLDLTPGREVVFGYEQDADGVYLRRRLTLSHEAQIAHRLPNLYALLDRPLLDDASHNSAILSLTYLAKRLVQRQSTGQAESGTFAHYKKHLRNLIYGAPEVLTVLPKFGRKRFLSGRRVPSLLLSSGDNRFYLYFHAEQSANPDARLTLSDQRDALGVPRLRIDGQLSPEDAEGILRAHHVIGQELERSGVGRLEFLSDDPLVAVQACASTLGHHIGAARMAEDPAQGVLDANGCVHGMDNLFVASAAMLPSSSQAHPTLTVLALALRLADHLSAQSAVSQEG